MAGKFVMLQKKLQELELELGDVIRLPIVPMAAEQTPFDDIKERIDFLEKLRVAEADSQQPNNSDDELHDIDRRFALLKAAFSDWNQSRNGGLIDGDDDTQSICSDCTQNQGIFLRESGSPRGEVEDFPGQRLPDNKLAVEKAAEAKVEAEMEAEEEETAVAAGRNWREFGKYCGVFGCGMIVGGVCLGLKLSFPDYLIFGEETFLIPPT